MLILIGPKRNCSFRFTYLSHASCGRSYKQIFMDWLGSVSQKPCSWSDVIHLDQSVSEVRFSVWYWLLVTFSALSCRQWVDISPARCTTHGHSTERRPTLHCPPLAPLSLPHTPSLQPLHSGTHLDNKIWFISLVVTLQWSVHGW